MHFGVTVFPTDYSMNVADLGRAVEERGFESLFFPEHTHIPTSRRSPWPAGGELPREYSHTLDPFTAFGAVAAVTSRLKLGTGICLVIEHYQKVGVTRCVFWLPPAEADAVMPVLDRCANAIKTFV